MKKILITVIVTLAAVLGIGLWENHTNTGHYGCQQFDTGTKYQGYHCKDDDVYIAN